ncbi:hypothetical protein KP509_21G004800 [Ceratopteris richardii]|uniref:DOPA 4,5-dioxygenase n=1 Tax=Ceratopteris richardii TaxID=49495 RepID=A0A8T2S912_CERRI|nr:hypothetical protein KP509_21G004800 [Ceratopteris richardii]
MSSDRLMPSKFEAPVRSYDVHVYFFHTDEENTKIAMELRDEIIRTFPDMIVYKLWTSPIGPHPVGMFEVDLKTPAEFALFVPWLNLRRRGLSALIHPNTGFPLLDHTQNALWLGEKFPLITSCLQQEDDHYGF